MGAAGGVRDHPPGDPSRVAGSAAPARPGLLSPIGYVPSLLWTACEVLPSRPSSCSTTRPRARMKGELFGVDVFFVLSGFLVTAGLLDEALASGGIRVRAFLARRARWLVPALGALLVVFWFSPRPIPSGAYAGHPVTLRGALGGVVVALVYGYNVFLIHVKVTPLPLGHLWTLAIEGQFYAGWVLVFAG